MVEKVKISRLQFSLLVMMFTIGSSILIIPSGLAKDAKQDAWIAVLVGVGVGVVLVALYIALGNRYKSMNLAEYSEVILGKWLGKTVSMLYFAFFFLLSALVLRNLGDFLNTYQLTKTPIIATHILFLLLVTFAVQLGLETFARASELFFPWAVVLSIVLFFFLSPQIEFKNLQPIMEGGVQPIVRASITIIGSPLLELVVFLMIFPSINRTQGWKTGFFLGYLMGAISLFMTTISAILVLGVDITAIQMYPSYEVAKKVNIADTFQRVEAIAAFIWFLTIFIKLTICFYASAICLTQALNLKDYRVVILPLAMIMIILSIIAYPNTAYYLTFVSITWPPLALLFGLFLPLLLLIISIIKKRLAN